MKKYVLSIEEVSTKRKTPRFVFASSDIDDVKDYITRKYKHAKRIYPTPDELRKENVVDKYTYIHSKNEYSFTYQRTIELQNKFILKIKIVDLKGDECDEG